MRFRFFHKRRASPGASGRAQLLKQVLRIQLLKKVTVERRLAFLVGPLLAGAIVVELQPVAARVVEVYSRTRRGLVGIGESVAVVEYALDCLGQLPPIGVEDG